MATFSSHLLDATNGSHAANVDVIIYQISESGEKKVFCKTKSDEGGRILHRGRGARPAPRFPPRTASPPGHVPPGANIYVLFNL